MRPITTIALVALRLVVLAAGVAIGAVGAVTVETALLPARASSDWGFGRLGTALWVGALIGLAFGFPLALRIGRRRLDGAARLLQTLAALAVPALLILGQCMEGAGGAAP